ncbi:hypothetical protein AAFF_G00188330 [Aldrovandia affinis]|uniref:Reverse transcriptase/retrotransposon-derived protein RNase H-like domain-containing protein n=1 Tax=Aldrovandia affinis TaxID=143900 RepID=A0AAD7WVB8_9TELE|nr:hypothetical protein AAFF_G00188330 [Aldrovandia affinis]
MNQARPRKLRTSPVDVGDGNFSTASTFDSPLLLTTCPRKLVCRQKRLHFRHRFALAISCAALQRLSGDFEGEVFAAIRQAGLCLNPKKCEFRRETAFLGHVVSADGVATDPAKSAAVRDWPWTVWDDPCAQAFNVLQTALITAPVLAYPDANRPFILDMDASNVGVGAVLSQPSDSGEQVIAY